MECRNHPGVEAADRCSACQEAFCSNCLVTLKGQKYCGSCKVSALAGGLPVIEQATQPCPEAAEALKTAIIGLFCFGIILEPVAISKALKAKKLIAANPNMTGDGQATAALVIGVVGLLLWILGLMARFAKI
ncbi:MAG TPA: DUF4190 domain-containing protein [Thermoanaerobaculia bacterium]|jgi:hypothetical protein|nr:DUF4190 domain-containing protein [Thermoanaerobaculia bacterium]